MTRGALWEWYKERRAEIRDEFVRYIDSIYLAADADCKGVLLNRLGIAKGIDPYSLFEGPFSRVEKYASEELYQWFAEHGRITYGKFEEDYVKGVRSGV